MKSLAKVPGIQYKHSINFSYYNFIIIAVWAFFKIEKIKQGKCSSTEKLLNYVPSITRNVKPWFSKRMK